MDNNINNNIINNINNQRINESKSKNSLLFSNLNISNSNPNQYKFYINNPSKNIQFNFKSNKINTTKYNLFTFLPKSLLLQFMRPANIYFLITAIIQCIPIISPLGYETAIFPILFVLSVSLIREGIEDYHRGQLDNEQNNKKFLVYRNNKWKEIFSGDLLMGEIVAVFQNNIFPADLILIDSEINEGICYIETGSLDGEKTLKIKSSPNEIAGMLNENKQRKKKFNIEGFVICDFPNPELYQLNGKMNLNLNNNKFEIPLEAKQLLLKGAKLKNTKWIIGIICYAGHNCKIIKNSKQPNNKYSTVECLMNRSLIFIFILQCIFCLISVILRGFYYNKNLKKYKDFIKLNDYNFFIESIISYFTYMLLLNTMIPISLIITMEIVKMVQGWFMSNDIEGFSKIRKKFIRPNSVSLNEELGLVNYIFSDKTGTLTCNKMLFKYCVIGEICYEFFYGNERIKKNNNNNFIMENDNILPFKKNEMSINEHNNNDNNNNDNNNNDNNNNINYKTTYEGYYAHSNTCPQIRINLEYEYDVNFEYWQALALCHDCSVQKTDNNEEYVGMSPDSLELVKAAREAGFILTMSENNSIRRIKIRNNKNKNSYTKDFEKLCLIEFSSERKRESIIVKDKVSNIIKLYIKGADSIIEERLSKEVKPGILKQCKYYVNKFSSLGYRTLLIGMKVLSQEEFNTFQNELNNAKIDLNNRKKRLNDIYDSIEEDIFLLGATIVEDKLQENVPETIRDLRFAGVKIWMLTGDKMNTAFNIALSCNLLSKNLKTFSICGVDVKKDENMKIINRKECEKIIINFVKEYQKFKGEYESMEKNLQFGILIDEKALLTINDDKEIQDIFLSIAKDAISVICCRVSPLQKSQVVKMIKNYDKKAITLAIGDGGNDVSMIMESHIGIGIYGEEGMRAVQSSDFAIGEFKIIHRLLFFHGRTSYLRNSECIHYFFYKNFVFTLVQFFYGFLNNFSGQSIMDDWFITLFNLLFTSLPLAVKACLEFDLKPDDGIIIKKMFPFLYLETRENPIFTKNKFMLTLLKGTIHCWINYYYVVYCLKNSIIDKNGNVECLWMISVNLFTNILIIISIDLIISTKYYTGINFIVTLISTFCFYLIFLFIVHHSNKFNSVSTMKISFNSAEIWINIIFTSGFCFFIDVVIKHFIFIFFPSLSIILQTLRNQGKISNEKFLPKSVYQKIKNYNNYVDNNNKNENENEKFEQKSEILKLKSKNSNEKLFFYNESDTERKEFEMKKNNENSLFNSDLNDKRLKIELLKNKINF